MFYVRFFSEHMIRLSRSKIIFLSGNPKKRALRYCGYKGTECVVHTNDAEKIFRKTFTNAKTRIAETFSICAKYLIQLPL